MGVAAGEITQSAPSPGKQQLEQPLEISAAKQLRRGANKTAALPQVDNEKGAVFTAPTEGEHNDNKMPKYAWHLILNHAQLSTLTKLSKNPRLRIPGLSAISSTHHDLTCRACLESKLKRAEHRRKPHNYKQGEAFSSDIMGPLNIPGLPEGVERYFISFFDVASRYVYVTPLNVRSKTPMFITKFLENVTKAFGRAPKWFIRDNAGEYMIQAM